MTVFDEEPYPVAEEGTGKLGGTLKDENGVAIPGTSFTTLTYTLYDQPTNGIINSRSAVDLKPFVNGSGVLALILYPADNPIVTPANVPTNGLERHIVLIRGTYGSPTKSFEDERQVDVRQRNRVPV